MINHLYDFEQLLFNAHEKKENVCRALEKLGGIVSAGKVSFWILGEDEETTWYFWEEGKTAEARGERSRPEYIGKLLELFASGNGTYESHDENEFRAIFPEEGLSGIYNVVAVPIEGVGGLISGILAACNVERGHEATALLKNMQFSFGMFCNNLKSYTEIQEQRDRDILTGLYNRNRYERDLSEIFAQYRNSLACVYIDANGLRETNNTKGHDKGDEMLQTVATEIGRHFDTEYIYRIGGDEFVLFVPEADEAKLKMQSEELSSALSKADYFISVGIQCDKNISSLSLLIKATEKKMYAEKKKYYEKHNRRKTHP